MDWDHVWVVVSHIADSLGIIGFLLSLVTLSITFNVKKEVNHQLQKQEFASAQKSMVNKLNTTGDLLLRSDAAAIKNIAKNIRDCYSLIFNADEKFVFLSRETKKCIHQCTKALKPYVVQEKSATPTREQLIDLGEILKKTSDKLKGECL